MPLAPPETAAAAAVVLVLVLVLVELLLPWPTAASPPRSSVARNRFDRRAADTGSQRAHPLGFTATASRPGPRGGVNTNSYRSPTSLLLLLLSLLLSLPLLLLLLLLLPQAGDEVARAGGAGACNGSHSRHALGRDSSSRTTWGMSSPKRAWPFRCGVAFDRGQPRMRRSDSTGAHAVSGVVPSNTSGGAGDGDGDGDGAGDGDGDGGGR